MLAVIDLGASDLIRCMPVQAAERESRRTFSLIKLAEVCLCLFLKKKKLRKEGGKSNFEICDSDRSFLFKSVYTRPKPLHDTAR